MTADVVHAMTRRDLIEGNPDLMAAAGALLAGGAPPRRLDATVEASADGIRIAVETRGLTSIDVYLKGRPAVSQAVTDGPHVVDLPRSPAGPLRIEGFDGDELVASRRPATS